MTSHLKLVDLLDDYMDADGQSERWITVQEFCTCFRLKKGVRRSFPGIFNEYTRT
jgi:hypothetical protein